jgi:hypothetical protein
MAEIVFRFLLRQMWSYCTISIEKGQLASDFQKLIAIKYLKSVKRT